MSERIQEAIDTLENYQSWSDAAEGDERVMSALELGKEALREKLLRETDTCEYHCDDVDDSPWECDKCGATWTLESGNPFENSMKFCSDCGRPIRSVRWNEWYYNSNEDCGDHEVVMTRAEYEAVARKFDQFREPTEMMQEPQPLTEKAACDMAAKDPVLGTHIFVKNMHTGMIHQALVDVDSYMGVVAILGAHTKLSLSSYGKDWIAYAADPNTAKNDSLRAEMEKTKGTNS